MPIGRSRSSASAIQAAQALDHQLDEERIERPGRLALLELARLGPVRVVAVILDQPLERLELVALGHVVVRPDEPAPPASTPRRRTIPWIALPPRSAPRTSTSAPYVGPALMNFRKHLLEPWRSVAK